MTLEAFLTETAEELAPLYRGGAGCTIIDTRTYREDTNSDAINGDSWLNNETSYIWKVGVLAQCDSNKMDYVRLFIGHERAPGEYDFIGVLYWRGGENDDIGRSIERYMKCIALLPQPVFETW